MDINNLVMFQWIFTTIAEHDTTKLSTTQCHIACYVNGDNTTVETNVYVFAVGKKT